LGGLFLFRYQFYALRAITLIIKDIVARTLQSAGENAVNNVLEHNEYADAPSVEIIGDAETREAVHAAFEKIVEEIDNTTPAEMKEELKATPARKCEGDVQRGYFWH
jgi:hypothetical protein